MDLPINNYTTTHRKNAMDISWLKCYIEKISCHFDFKKIHSPSTKINNNAIGPVEKQIGQVNIHHGLTYFEAKDLIESVVDQKLMSFQNDAKTVYDSRVDTFKNALFEKIKALPNEEIEKLKEPDTQVILMEAAKISGRKQDEDLKNLLADLVIKRIKNDNSGKEELKNLVYNEAILTINKLTIDQLKIITLCYLLRYTQNPSVNSWDRFKLHLENYVSPFLDFKNTIAEFQHIEYTGCGSLSIGITNWDLIETFRSTYSILFFNYVERDLIDTLSLQENIKNDICILVENENKYYMKFRNKDDFQKYLTEKHVDTEVSTKLLNIYWSHIKNPDEIKKMVFDCSENGKKMMNIWENSFFKLLSLTSVGIAIGACYYEQKTGAKEAVA